jgi:hypothetical protein
MPDTDPKLGTVLDKHLSHNVGNPVHNIFSPPPRPVPDESQPRNPNDTAKAGWKERKT